MRQPDPLAQHRAPVLDVWASLNGFVVGYVGGAYRETVAEFASSEDALSAYRAARAATFAKIGAKS